ncbi:hypothetical protein SLA2020_254610 [Shorea laevis]
MAVDAEGRDGEGRTMWSVHHVEDYASDGSKEGKDEENQNGPETTLTAKITLGAVVVAAVVGRRAVGLLRLDLVGPPLVVAIVVPAPFMAATAVLVGLVEGKTLFVIVIGKLKKKKEKGFRFAGQWLLEE